MGSTIVNNTMMINVIYKKRALPLAYIVVTGKKGHFPEQSHIALVKEVHEMMAQSNQRVVFLGDGEFDGCDLQKTLKDLGWLYVCRTGLNIKIFIDDEVFDVGLLSAFLPPGSYRYWRKILFSHKNYGPVTVIVWWTKNNEEPIYDPVDLLSSQKNWHNILCVIVKQATSYCVLIFKIGVNQQIHLSGHKREIAQRCMRLLF